MFSYSRPSFLSPNGSSPSVRLLLPLPLPPSPAELLGPIDLFSVKDLTQPAHRASFSRSEDCETEVLARFAAIGAEVAGASCGAQGPVDRHQAVSSGTRDAGILFFLHRWRSSCRNTRLQESTQLSIC
jgi:hypothetical protein